MSMLSQLKRSFVGSFTGDSGGAPMDPTRPGETPLAAWARDGRHHGALAEPTVSSSHTGPCGDSIGFSLRMEGERIVDVGVEVHGCQFTAAAGHYVAAQVHGRTMHEALELSAMDVYRAIPQLGAGHIHCGMLSLLALHQALALHSLFETGHLQRGPAPA